jgi:Ca-activated chloride channel family protein
LLDDYAFLSQAAGGKSFILDAHGRRIEGLVTLFKEVAVSIADSSVLRTSGSVGSRVDVESVRRSFWRNALQAGIWTGLICIGVGVPVQFVQRGILGSQFDPFAVLRAVSVCMALGFVSGVLGQGLYAFALASSPDAGTWSRIVSWVFIGAGLGLSLSAAVPNLDVRRSILFGGFGGGIAAVGFIVLASSGSDSASRLLGAALMGLCISESVTIAEALAREAHLLIHWGQNETTCVNLGPSPVVVGTSRDSTVRLPPSSGYPAQVASFVLRGGKAILINHMTQSQHPLKDGNKLKLGAMTIEVRLFAHGRGVSPP